MRLMENHIRLGERTRQKDIKNIYNDLVTGAHVLLKRKLRAINSCAFHQVVEDLEVAVPSEQTVGV
ncbi:MAG: hypothetical protein H6925_07155 [Holosporaceae bacterium]|nr:MAG: hypothetical protein H6925_07155 [Holosporaceae bacterium]